MYINIKKIKKMAEKITIRQAKQKLADLKEKGKKINKDQFEEYVKNLYKKNLKFLFDEAKRKKSNLK